MRLRFQNKLIEVGVDEAGRGCLAGPVFAAAVFLPNDFCYDGIDDSKKLTEKQRLEVRKYIEMNAVDYAVASVDEKIIDKVNILQSSILAMHRAIEKLKCLPQFISVDGNKFNSYKEILHKTIIKGDGKYMNIAAASILAKTYRDEFMVKLGKEYPEYSWKNNKGYPTKKHYESIKKYGITKYHRKSFRLFQT